jgi:hypothetical protein
MFELSMEESRPMAVMFLSLSVTKLVQALHLLMQLCGSSLRFLYVVANSIELFLTLCRPLAMTSLLLETYTPHYERMRYVMSRAPWSLLSFT